jgi:CDP-6-deoxy-D-xylo-4-hexulose-3-dehydrase
LSTFAVPIICKTKELRERYIEQFSGAGVEIRPMIAGNMTKQPFYAKYVEAQYELPNTDIIHENGFYCGNYPELSETDLQTIESCLMKY